MFIKFLLQIQSYHGVILVWKLLNVVRLLFYLYSWTSLFLFV
jgi:hypothetical protein